jgi:manganese/zinc/iron transport system permease protein
MTELAPLAAGAAAEVPAWLRFLTLQDANVRWVLAGSMLLGAGSGVLGCFTFLRKQALLGDALAHAALPGVCLAFLVFQSKHPALLLLGAIVTGWLAIRAIDLSVRGTRIKEDTALALVLSVFFAAGIVLLTRIQQSGAASQAGLDRFLFGQAAGMVERDVLVLGGMALALIAAVTLVFKEFKIVAFDAEFAATLGVSVRRIDALLAVLVVVAVCIGLSAVGVVLMAAMLVTPAAAARFWTDRLDRMLLLAGLFGAAAGAVGTFISFLAPRMPTGPWMVTAVTLVFAVSLLFAPRRGVVARALLHWRNRRKTADENLLTTLFRFDEGAGSSGQAWPVPEMARLRAMSEGRARRVLRRLENQGLVLNVDGSRWRLTPPGVERAARLIRLHRLWEIYLTERLHLASDHVHGDAEDVEHFLTPELEAELERILNRPAKDPHGRLIPYAPPARPEALEPPSGATIDPDTNGGVAGASSPGPTGGAP